MQLENERLGAQEGATLLRRFDWLFAVRPMPLAELLMKVLTPADRRRCVSTSHGIRLFVDPLSNLGRSVVSTGTYEPEVVRVFEEVLQPGHVVLDVGANEGFFSCLAAKRVGDSGRVVAVEPQGRLQGVLEVNFRLNGMTSFSITQVAIGTQPGSQGLFLAPTLNHGASSFVRRSAFWRQSESVRVVTASQLWSEQGLDVVDFVKVDVEGHEDQVVQSLLPLCAAGKVRALLLDYHSAVLERKHVAAADIHRSLLESGMTAEGEPKLDSYVLYRVKRPR